MSYRDRKNDRYRDYSGGRRREPTKRVKYPGKRMSHITVVPQGDEHIDKTIRRFIRKVKKSGLADEYKKRRFYEKPSTKERRRKLRREATIRKANEKSAN